MCSFAESISLSLSLFPPSVALWLLASGLPVDVDPPNLPPPFHPPPPPPPPLVHRLNFLPPAVLDPLLELESAESVRKRLRDPRVRMSSIVCEEPEPGVAGGRGEELRLRNGLKSFLYVLCCGSWGGEEDVGVLDVWVGVGVTLDAFDSILPRGIWEEERGEGERVVSREGARLEIVLGRPSARRLERLEWLESLPY